MNKKFYVKQVEFVVLIAIKFALINDECLSLLIQLSVHRSDEIVM